MHLKWKTFFAFASVMYTATLVIVGTALASGHKHSPPRSFRHLKTAPYWLSCSLMMKPGMLHFSPDGKYRVETYGPGNNGEVSIDLEKSRLPYPERYLKQSQMPLGHDDPGRVFGFVWLRGKPHTLIFASSGDPGFSMLALWNGGLRVHMLHRVESAEGDGFELYAVSRDSKRIVYGWQSDAEKSGRDRKNILRLPRKLSF